MRTKETFFTKFLRVGGNKTWKSVDLQVQRLHSDGNNNNSLLVISNIIENYEFNYFESRKRNGRILIIKPENEGGEAEDQKLHPAKY